MPWSFDFVSFWKLLETTLECICPPPWEDRPEKSGLFGHPKGVRGQLCFLRPSGHQFGSHLDVFGKVPNTVLPLLSESFSILWTERTHSIYMPDMYISRAYQICISDEHIGPYASRIIDTCNETNKNVLLSCRFPVILIVRRSLARCSLVSFLLLP